MRKCEFFKESYEAPRIDYLVMEVEKGFSISNENGAGGGSFGGGFDEFDVTPGTGSDFGAGDWPENEDYYE